MSQIKTGLLISTIVFFMALWAASLYKCAQDIIGYQNEDHYIDSLKKVQLKLQIEVLNRELKNK